MNKKLTGVITAALIMSITIAIPAYAESGRVFKFIVSAFVPEDGITIDGRTYTEDEINQVIDEIENDSYGYSHKEHHCILSNMSDEEIGKLVSMLKFLGKL